MSYFLATLNHNLLFNGRQALTVKNNRAPAAHSFKLNGGMLKMNIGSAPRSKLCGDAPDLCCVCGRCAEGGPTGAGVGVHQQNTAKEEPLRASTAAQPVSVQA